MTIYRCLVRSLIIATTTILFNGLKAQAADQWIDASARLRALCNAPRSQAVYRATLSIPPSIGFLLGEGATLAHESAQIEDYRAGAHDLGNITATSGPTVLASGFSDHGIGIRLVIDEKHFCVDHPKVVLTYSMADAVGTQLPGLRVALTPSDTEQDLTLTSDGYSLTLNNVDRKYAKGFKPFIDDSFSWPDLYLRPIGDGGLYSDDRYRLRTATALAHFFENIDPMKIVAHNEPLPLSVWGGHVAFRGRSILSPSGVLQEDDYNPISVDLSFTNDDVISIRNRGVAGNISLQISEIKQQEIRAQLEDE